MHYRSINKAVDDNFHLAKEDGATFSILRNNKQEIYLLRSEKAIDSTENDL
jgi:lipoprotein signal peptidase